MEEKNCCGSCRHYKKHYSLSKIGYLELNCGHCRHNVKNKRMHKNDLPCSCYDEIDKKEVLANKELSLKRAINNINKDLKRIIHYLEINNKP